MKMLFLEFIVVLAVVVCVPHISLVTMVNANASSLASTEAPVVTNKNKGNKTIVAEKKNVRHRYLQGAGGVVHVGIGLKPRVSSSSSSWSDGRTSLISDDDDPTKIILSVLGIMCLIVIRVCALQNELNNIRTSNRRRSELRASNRNWVMHNSSSLLRGVGRNISNNDDNNDPAANNIELQVRPQQQQQPPPLLVFPSGKWRGYYHQYNHDHSLFEFDLYEDINNNDDDPSSSITSTTISDGIVVDSSVVNNNIAKLKGEGTDHVGQYTLKGWFSKVSGRMSLVKRYIKGTGSWRENKGHSVDYRGEIRGDGRNFAAGIGGTWEVITNDYHGKGIFHLWPVQLVVLRAEPQPSPLIASSIIMSADSSSSQDDKHPQAASTNIHPLLTMGQDNTNTEECIPLMLSSNDNNDEKTSHHFPTVASIKEEGRKAAAAVFIATNNDKCVVCFDRTVNTLLQPCGHIALCGTCAQKLDACPICRSVITHSIVTVRSNKNKGKKKKKMEKNKKVGNNQLGTRKKKLSRGR